MANDLYQTVTNSIIEAIKEGVKPWECPWQRSPLGVMPANYKTKTAYSGINVLVLWAAASKVGYKRNAWLTFKQAKELGGNVRKGEKSVSCVFFKNVVSDKNDDESPTTYPMIKPFWLFNVDQIDGIDFSDLRPASEGSTFDPIEKAEAVLKQSGAVIKEQGDRALYVPSQDMIVMPEKERFSTAEDYYTTIFHELTHWTGHPTRLNRNYGKRFADDAYAFEELIAELGSAFINTELNINGELDHASYLDHWLKILKQDKRAIFTAASQASKAHQWIMEG